jgi:hypothetical protein
MRHSLVMRDFQFTHGTIHNSQHSHKCTDMVHNSQLTALHGTVTNRKSVHNSSTSHAAPEKKNVSFP